MSTGSNGEKRARSRNFTEVEKEIFIDICHGFIDVIENKVINALTTQQKCYAWEQIAEKYNSIQKTGYRNPIQLKSLYEQLKKNARKNKGEQSSDNKPKHTVTIEEKVRALLSINFEPLNTIERENVADSSILSSPITDKETLVSVDVEQDVKPLGLTGNASINCFPNICLSNRKRRRSEEMMDKKLEILNVILETEKENLRGKRLENEIKEVDLKVRMHDLDRAMKEKQLD